MNKFNFKENIYTKNLFKWGDILLIVLLIVAIVLTVLFATQTGANKVEVFLDGNLKYTYSLDENKTMELLDGRVKVKIENQTVRIIESDCKNQICVETKPIGIEGGVIVCLPNKVLVKVSKGGPQDITY